jgi:hypothetical protein
MVLVRSFKRIADPLHIRDGDPQKLLIERPDMGEEKRGGILEGIFCKQMFQIIP